MSEPCSCVEDLGQGSPISVFASGQKRTNTAFVPLIFARIQIMYGFGSFVVHVTVQYKAIIKVKNTIKTESHSPPRSVCVVALLVYTQLCIIPSFCDSCLLLKIFFETEYQFSVVGTEVDLHRLDMVLPNCHDVSYPTAIL